MIENKEFKFVVKSDSKWIKWCNQYQDCLIVVFTCDEIGRGHERSFLAYYGSQPCYGDDYASFGDYDYEIDFDELSEMILCNDEYYEGLRDRNLDLFHKFYDDDDNFIWEGDEQAAHDLIEDAFRYFPDFDSIIHEKAQEAADNEEREGPDY